MEKQEVKCKFGFFNWSLKDNIYTCSIKNEIILEDVELAIIGKHKKGKGNQHVKAVDFDDCTISKIPQGLINIFPNLLCLQIVGSKLMSIEQKDLIEYKDLVIISLPYNDFQFLTGDLFNGMKNLEYISLNNNKIVVIEPNLLNGLDKLKLVNFKGNPCIDKCFDSTGNDGDATMREIKDEIRSKYLNSPWRKIFDEKSEVVKGGSSSNLKENIPNENSKDFTVQVGDEEFKVHKLLLAARSPVLKEIIHLNIDAECLKLVDIPKEIFREILSFIYTDKLPQSDDINFLHLFIAAGRLKIEDLKKFAAEKLVFKLSAENALEMLTLANKYDSKILRQKSFEIIKNELNEVVDEITDDMAMNTEELKKLLKILKEKDGSHLSRFVIFGIRYTLNTE